MTVRLQLGRVSKLTIPCGYNVESRCVQLYTTIGNVVRQRCSNLCFVDLFQHGIHVTMQRYPTLFQQVSNATTPILLQLSFCICHVLKHYVVSLLRKRCLITNLRLFFNCSSVDGHLSSSANVNYLTTMAVSQSEIFDFMRATVFFVWDAASQFTNLPVVQKFGEAIAPFGYAYPNNLSNSFNVLLLPWGSYCYALFSEKKNKKQIIWNRQNFLKKNARIKKNTGFFFRRKEFV